MADIVFSAAGRTAMLAHIAAGTNMFGTGSMLVLGTGQYIPDGTETGVNTAFSPAKQFAISGVVSSSTKMTIGLVDSNLTDVYNAGEIAILGTGGTFYGIVSQEAADGWLLPKVSGSHALWSGEIVLDTGTTANITFTINFAFVDASTTTKGKVFIATGLSDTRDDAAIRADHVKAETDDIRSDFAAADTAQTAAINTALGGKANVNLQNIVSTLGPAERETVLKRIAPGVQTLTDAANISWNANNGSQANVTIAADRTLNVFTNGQSGSYYELAVTADGGGRTLTLAAGYAKGDRDDPEEIDDGDTAYYLFRQQGSDVLYMGELGGYDL